MIVTLLKWKLDWWKKSSSTSSWIVWLLFQSRPHHFDQRVHTRDSVLIQFTSVASRGGGGPPGWHHLKGWLQEEKINKLVGKLYVYLYNRSTYTRFKCRYTFRDIPRHHSQASGNGGDNKCMNIYEVLNVVGFWNMLPTQPGQNAKENPKF